jgi:hypothetical protein
MKILVINPNSTESVTVGLKEALDPVAPPGVELGYFTAPSKAPPSSHTFHLSCLCGVYCFEELLSIGAFEEYDAFLVCCCSGKQSPDAVLQLLRSSRLRTDHPLQHMIRDHLRTTSRKPAIGMFEAGISHCLMLGKVSLNALPFQTSPTLTVLVPAALRPHYSWPRYNRHAGQGSLRRTRCFVQRALRSRNRCYRLRP